MAQVTAGQTAYGIVQSLKTTPEEFLKQNPTFAAKGGSRDYLGLTGDIQVGQQYNFVPPAPVVPSVTPTPGSGNYAEDLAKSFQTTPIVPSAPVGTSDAERTRLRNEEIERIKQELEPSVDKPTVYKSADEFARLRKEQGIVNDEEELAAIRNEANLGKQELRQFSATAGEGTSEGGRIGMMSEKERNLNFRLEGLALRESVAIDRLNSKNAYIGTMLNLGQQDYQNASTEYANEYNKNVKAIDIYNTQLNERQKDALTGFTTLTNLLKDKNIDLNKIDPALKTQIDSLALKAGLPTGLFEAFASAYPDQKILAPITVKNASGGEDVYFFTQDPKTGQPSLIQTVGIQGAGVPSPSGQTVIGADGKPVTYTPGSDTTVDSWVQNILNGQSKLTDIPGNTIAGGILRNKVIVALAAYGNSPDGKPVTTEIGKEALKTAEDLLAKFNNRQGTAAVGTSNIFQIQRIPGTASYNFATTFQSLKDQLALDSVKLLKGQGSVSDAERALLASAVTKLNLGQSEPEFKTTLETIVNKLKGGVTGSYSVTAPDGNTYIFNSQSELDAFKKEAGL